MAKALGRYRSGFRTTRRSASRLYSSHWSTSKLKGKSMTAHLLIMYPHPKDVKEFGRFDFCVAMNGRSDWHDLE